MTGGPVPGAVSWRPAPVGWRLVARAVDAAGVVWLLAFVVVEIGERLLGGDPLGRRVARLVVDDLRSAVLVLVALAAYEIVPVRLWGATLGKALVGLRVVDATVTGPGPEATGGPGTPVPWATSVSAGLRAVLLYGPFLVAGQVGLVVAAAHLASLLVSTTGRGLHDLVAGTRVVQIDVAASAGDGELA